MAGDYTFTAGRSAKINFLADLLVLLAATFWALPDAPAAGALAGLIMLAIMPLCVWTIMAAALHIYDPWSPRSAIDATAMLTVSVMAVATVMGVLEVIGPDRPTPEPGTFVLVSWPLIVGLRLLV